MLQNPPSPNITSNLYTVRKQFKNTLSNGKYSFNLEEICHSLQNDSIESMQISQVA